MYLVLHLLASETLYLCVIDSIVALICAFLVKLQSHRLWKEYFSVPLRGVQDYYQKIIARKKSLAGPELYDVIKEKENRPYTFIVGLVNQMFSINVLNEVSGGLYAWPWLLLLHTLFFCSAGQHGRKEKKKSYFTPRLLCCTLNVVLSCSLTSCLGWSDYFCNNVVCDFNVRHWIKVYLDFFG